MIKLRMNTDTIKSVAYAFSTLLVVSIVGALVITAQTTHAAYNFGYLQPGSMNSSQAPAFSASSALFFWEYTYGYNGTMPTNAAGFPDMCAFGAMQAGIPDTESSTCITGTYQTDSVIAGLPGGGGVGGPSSCGTLCVGSAPMRFNTSYVEVYRGTNGPFRTSCPVENGPGIYGIGTISGSACDVSIHNGTPTPEPAPTAAIYGIPETIAPGANAAVTHICTNATSASISNIGPVVPGSGTTLVTPNVTTSYTLTCTNAVGSANATATITVLGSTQADLTAAATSPSSAKVGTSVSFSAPILNIGNASSGSFPVRFQIMDNSLTTTIGNTVSNYLSVEPGASEVANAPYTFSSAGSYMVRACANQNGASTNIVSESDYSNNCGPWTTVVVGAAYASPPTCSLSSSGPTIPTALNWSSTNATSCTGAGFSTGGATSGSVSTNTAGNYSLSCTGAGGSCTANTSVDDNTCSGTPVISITANPTRVRAGQTSTISWSATNVPGASPSCTVTGPGVSRTIPAGALPTCAIPNGSATPTINTQSIYTINCAGTSKSVTVNVIPVFQEF